MSMDAIKQVADSEQQAKTLLAQAQQDAKALVEQARKDGESKLAEARKDAQTQVRAMLAQAEEAGGEKTRQSLERYDADCQALKARAAERLDRAAELIVGKVVSG